MKRIIWVAQDRRHRILSVWWKNRHHNGVPISLKVLKLINVQHAYYITKHYIEV